MTSDEIFFPQLLASGYSGFCLSVYRVARYRDGICRH